MTENWPVALKLMLGYEGGFSDDPHDPGGMTNLGVTKDNWTTWVRREVSEDEMRSLTPEAVAPFYRVRYWNPLRCDDLPSGLDLCVFDCGVNAGPQQSARLLQRCLGVVQDGHIGIITLNAIKGKDLRQLIEEFSQAREKFYRSLPLFDRYGKGWLNRTESVKLVATHALDGPLVT
jgi:lysozyme family protein